MEGGFRRLLRSRNATFCGSTGSKMSTRLNRVWSGYPTLTYHEVRFMASSFRTRFTSQKTAFFSLLKMAIESATQTNFTVRKRSRGVNFLTYFIQNRFWIFAIKEENDKKWVFFAIFLIFCCFRGIHLAESLSETSRNLTLSLHFQRFKNWEWLRWKSPVEISFGQYRKFKSFFFCNSDVVRVSPAAVTSRGIIRRSSIDSNRVRVSHPLITVAKPRTFHSVPPAYQYLSWKKGAVSNLQNLLQKFYLSSLSILQN